MKEGSPVLENTNPQQQDLSKLLVEPDSVRETQNDENTIILKGRQFKFATMNRRLIASAIDMFIITVVLGPILNLGNYFIYKGNSAAQVLENFTTQGLDPMDTLDLVNYLSKNGFLFRYIIAQLIAFFALGAFMMVFWKWKGATPGKMLTRCEIVDANNGDIPTFKQSMVRFFGYILSTIPLCIGFFIIPYTKKKQGFHDMLANTVVVVRPWKLKQKQKQ